MMRTLVAALACRVQGSRLYGKPLQNLAGETSILDHILVNVDACPDIDRAVLGISEGVENIPFIDVAKRHGAGYIVGDQKDVLMRLIQCGRAGQATDIFRITTECPFTMWEMVEEAWRRHVAEERDVTALDHVTEGVGFEIYRLEALERAWRDAQDEQRSEYANAYLRTHQDEFSVAVVIPPPPLDRMDLRLTVDYPEDLVLCRRIYEAFANSGPVIPMSDIYAFCDAHPELTALVASYSDPGLVWKDVPATIGLKDKSMAPRE